MNWQNKDPILKGCINFQKEILKKVCQNMHFDASDPSTQMTTDFTSSASDMRIVIISEFFNEIDLGSRRNTASVVLTTRISVTINLSRRYAADNFSSFASAAERTGYADSQRFAAGGNFRLFPNHQTTEALSKERTNLQTKNLFDCVKLQITQKS